MPPRLPRLPHYHLSFSRCCPALLGQKIPLKPSPSFTFTTSQSRSAQPTDNTLPNHYAALDLPPTATPSDIKKAFYTLSKRHHPDTLKRTGQPASPDRFHAISDAYHTLGDATSRARYDRDYTRAYGPPAGSSSSPSSFQYAPPGGGSYSSHAGSRPASGLSRRRTQFRGPPPSFYQNGGWGATAGRRAANATAGMSGNGAGGGRAEAGRGRAESASTGGWGGGFGPGQTRGADDESFPYWDHEAHRKRQDGVMETLERRRRQRQDIPRPVKDDVLAPEGDTLFKFIMVSGLVVVTITTPLYLLSVGSNGPPRKEKEGKG